MSSISLTLGLRGRLLSGTQVTLQGALFGNNEPGFTFEPWDITTLYQDRAGTTPVTDAGQSVGKRLDKSGRGNHQTAINDSARGIYGWMPKTGRRNLLTYTEQFDNAIWLKTAATITANATVAPDGTTTADKITEDATSNWHGARQVGGTGVSCVFSFYAKAAERSRIWVAGDTPDFLAATAVFDLSAGTVQSGTGTITAAGNGWYRCSIVATISARGGTVAVANNAGAVIRLGDGASGVYVWGAQLELGASATAYQRVASQYDITEAGVPTCYYVQADGVDDAYVTPTITPNTDKAQVFAGVRKLSDALQGCIVELGITAPNGSVSLWAPPYAGGGFAIWSKGTLLSSNAYTPTPASPVSQVVSGYSNISTDTAVLRLNGVQSASSVQDQGTGNYLAYPAYIYARSSGTLPFNGLDFGHAVRFGPNLDAATIARVESLIARNTPEVTL